MEDQIRERLRQAANDHVFPGAVVGVLRDTKVSLLPVGHLTYDPTSPHVTSDTLYDVASLTKTIPTSLLALQLIDEGGIKLQDSVTRFLPAFSHKEVTIWHLLTQTVSFTSDKGFFQLALLKERTPDEILNAIYTADFSAPPGQAYSYNNTTSILLGLVIEKVTGTPLDELAAKRLFQPLKMTQTTFHPEKTAFIAPTEIDPWRGREIRGEVHDESAFTLQKKIIPGSAGLFSTVPDLLRLLQMLLKKGTYDGKAYFSERMVEMMTTNQLAQINAYAGLGLEMKQHWVGANPSQTMLGKTGFTGCSLLFDLTRQKALVILSNRTYPHRPSTGDLINSVRRDISDIVFEDAV